MKVVLVSVYDLGRQPFGLASPAAWLREAGHDVRLLDLAVEEPDEATLRDAGVIAFHLPMHTATRHAARLLPWVRGAEAVDCYEHAIHLYRADGDRYNEAETLVRLGTVHEAAHQPVPARRAWREALTILREIDHPDADGVEGRLDGLPSTP